MHVIISIDDQADGTVSVKTLVYPVAIGDTPSHSPATELGDFLQLACDLWRETVHMNKQQLHAYTQSLMGRSHRQQQ